MIENLHPRLRYALKKFGLPQRAKGLSPEGAILVKDAVPGTLSSFIIQFGLCALGPYGFRFCDPCEYKFILDMVLRGDRELKQERSVVIGFTDFGHVIIWNKDCHIVRVDLYNGLVIAHGLFDEDFRLDPDYDSVVPISTLDSEIYDFLDEDDTPMHDQALARLGQPAHDECFGFVPALALGGSARLESVRRLKAREHFAIVAQASSFKLINADTIPNTIVRFLGA